MDLRQLRTFIQVAEMRSITRASAVLHVAQPALSRQIKILEEEIGEQLFERNERGVQLTSAGERLLSRASALVREFDLLRSEVSGKPSNVSGHVRLGVPKSLLESVMTPVLVEFCERYPSISMLLLDGTTLDLRDQIRGGALDLAIVSDLDRSPSARMQAFMREPIVLASHADDKLRMGHSVNAQFVSELLLAIPNRPNVIRLTLDDVLVRGGQQARIGLETNSHRVVCAFAMSGKMYGVLPYSAIASELDAGRATAAPIADAELSWNIIVTPLRELSPQARVLRTFLFEASHRLIKKRRWFTAPPVL